jgi:hypothetical protein
MIRKCPTCPRMLEGEHRPCHVCDIGKQTVLSPTECPDCRSVAPCKTHHGHRPPTLEEAVKLLRRAVDQFEHLPDMASVTESVIDQLIGELNDFLAKCPSPRLPW